ncbi:MAG: T9SS type A sorting domain-containing protein [Lewinellaceae bacterium]|nr:T9SS type A sorting domain-containing protein [Lewinellaceae bacterium]
MMVNSFEPQTSAFQWSVYPNPVITAFDVIMEIPGMVEVFDLSGKRWFSTTSTERTCHIPCQHWPSGLYVVLARSNTVICEMGDESPLIRSIPSRMLKFG